MIASILSGIVAKLGAASVAAKATAGMAVAAASIGGAAAAGVLPDVLPSPAPEPVEVVTDADDLESMEEDDLMEEGEGEPAPQAEFGQSVSADAGDPDSPGVDGAEISQKARELGASHRPANPGSAGLERAGGTPAAGHAPESVPSPSEGADQRPATPATPPAPAENDGADTAQEPPAPVDTPAGPPSETPAGAPSNVPAGRG